MPRYIDAEELKRIISANEWKNDAVPCVVRIIIDRIPTADVQEVKKTRWVHLGGDEWCCSNCGDVFNTEGSWNEPTKRYCENCGAKNEEVADDAEIH